MSNFVELEQKLFAHDLQCANFSCILLLSKENLAVATLSDLCEDLEITLAETDSSLSKIGTLSSSILLPNRVVGLFGCLRGRRKLGLKLGKSVLSRANVGKKVEVVVEEVCWGLAIFSRHMKLGRTELRNIRQSLDIGFV